MAPESRKEQRAALAAALRRDGHTWEETATELRRREPASPMLALRWAHNLSQEDVADAYNKLLTSDPHDKPINFRRVSRWELWPHGGTQPPLGALNRLAKIFQVRASFLFDGADYRDHDPNYRPDDTIHGDLPPAAPTATSPAGLRHPRRPGDRTPLTIRPDQLATFDPRSPHQAFGLSPHPHLLVLTGRTPMERRTVLEVIASIPGVTLLTGTNSLLDPEATDILANAIKRPDKVGPKALGPLGDLIMGYRRLDDILGARYVTEPVTAFLQLMRNVLPAAEPGVRQPLFSLSASASQLAGWLALDSGNHAQARELYDQAIEWAIAADDTALVAYLWSCRSLLAQLDGDPLGAMSTAEAARRVAAGQRPKLRARVECVAGHAYALAGNRKETVRAMHQAAELFAAAEPDGAPDWLYHFQPGDLTAEHAAALVDLGEGARAAEMLAEAIEQLGPNFVRDRGIWLANQATAFRVAGDVKQACVTGTEAVLIGRQTGSARTVEKVGRLYRSLTREASGKKASQLPEVRALGDLLRDQDLS